MTDTTFDYQHRRHPKDLRLTRTVKASRERIWDAFTKAEQVARWWAPKPFTTHDCAVDLRPGGLWTYTFRSPDGQRHDCTAVYEAVEPPAQLVIVQAVPGPGGRPFFRIRQTITLQEKGKDTVVTLAAKILEANPGSDPFLAGMEQGTNGTLDNLLEYLASLS